MRGMSGNMELLSCKGSFSAVRKSAPFLPPNLPGYGLGNEFWLKESRISTLPRVALRISSARTYTWQTSGPVEHSVCPNAPHTKRKAKTRA